MTSQRPQTPDKKLSKQTVKTPKPPKVEFDLSDEELENVSGGRSSGGGSVVGSVATSAGG